MTDTSITRHQTRHQDENLASPILADRLRSARLTGGGNLTWDIAGGLGTFTWDAPLYIEFPSMPWKIQIDINGVNPGTLSSIADDEALYIEIPFIDDGGSNVDDVYPAGTWDVGLNPTLVLPYTSIQKATGPISSDAVAADQFFFIGIRTEGDQLVMHNDCILSDGVPGSLGSGSNAGSRVIFAAPPADWGDIGISYAPNQNLLHVYVNGVYQKPARYDGAVADGYLSIANADYKEIPITGGSVSDTLYGGIEWTTSPSDSTPTAGEIVTIILGGGAMGPPGPPGPAGGLQNAYDNGTGVDLDYDVGSHTQTQVDLEEGLDAADIDTLAGPTYELLNAPSLSALEVVRTANHPDANEQQKVAFIVDSIGNLGAAGAFLFNPHNLATLQTEMDGSGAGHGQGVFFVGMDNEAGAPTPEDKLIFHFLRQADLSGISIGAGGEARQLQQFRMNSLLTPSLAAGELKGQLAVNKAGELATGWARDFVRWHVLDIVFPTNTGADVYATSFTLNADVIEPTAEFIGGFATHPIDSDDYEVFFHANPTNAYVGDNPYELKLAIETVGSTRHIRVTYGTNLIGYTSKIILFFSSEYSLGASAPDEGDFT